MKVKSPKVIDSSFTYAGLSSKKYEMHTLFVAST